MKRHAAAATIFSAIVAACGGTVVFESQGDDGANGDGDGDASTSAQSTGTGAPTTCTSTDDCKSDEVCALQQGVCARRCDPESCDACGPGTQCIPCATSSCPGCKDCVSACIPTPGCDDDDACGVGFACDFALKNCVRTCNADGTCEDGGACSLCATGSCCGCRDCVDLCILQ